MDVSSKEISVILQCPISPITGDTCETQGTQGCIDNLRQFLPEAEIIISTWEGSDVSGLTGYDKLIFSKDPGAITYNDDSLKNVFNNVNRQIVSTYAGLKEASKKYAIKFRSDLRMNHTGFIKHFDSLRSYRSLQLFSSRIITSNVYVRDWTKVNLLNHISDIFQFGFTNDLVQLWNIPLQPEPETTRAFPPNRIILNDINWNRVKLKYTPEQYIWVSFLMLNNIDVSLKYYTQIPLFKIKKSIISLVDNFIILSNESIGITMSPKLLQHNIANTLNEKRWKDLYNIICIEKNKVIILKEILSAIKTSLKTIVRNRKNILKLAILKLRFL